MNMEGFFLCYGDKTPGSVEPTGEHASCFVGGSSECLAQGSLKYLFVQPAPRPIKTRLRTLHFGNKKIHTLQSVMHGRSSFTLQRGSTLLALSVQSLSFDDNGITGLFSISHSEVVFVSFPVKPLAAQSLCFGGSLCHIFTDYSSLQRVFFLFTPCIVDSFFLSVKCFLQIIKKFLKNLYLFVLPAALFILFTASTWTWVIWIYLILFHDCS